LAELSHKPCETALTMTQQIRVTYTMTPHNGEICVLYIYVSDKMPRGIMKYKTWCWRQQASAKHRWIFNGTHSVTFQVP